jgi:hypothetical protein
MDSLTRNGENTRGLHPRLEAAVLGPAAECLALVLGPRGEHQHRAAGTLRSGAAIGPSKLITGGGLVRLICRGEYSLPAPVPP